MRRNGSSVIGDDYEAVHFPVLGPLKATLL